MKNKKTISATIGILIFVFGIGVAIITPSIVESIKDRKTKEIMGNLEKIHTSAVIVEKIEGGLLQDIDETGKYVKLSESSGFRVYSSAAKNKYYIIRENGQIIVRYGENLQYPEVNQPTVTSGIITNEDLFNYDESSGKVVITGFSEQGVELLRSDNVIQIPSSYKGREVTEIAEKAFYNRNIMETVIIPNTIKKIGKHAFSNNGPKGMSNDIGKPYEGSWKIKDDKWEKQQ